MRYASKSDVLELLKRAKKVLHLMVIAGGLTSGSGSSLGTYGSKAERKYHKARAFHQKVSRLFCRKMLIIFAAQCCGLF